jgi:hypothetical protein
MRNKHKREDICNSLVGGGELLASQPDNHSQSNLVDNQINDLRRCQGSENKSSQKPTKTDTFMYYGKDLASERHKQ